MTILGFLFFAFIFYLAFRLVFDFIISVYRTTKKVRRGFRDMQDRMNQHAEQYNKQTNSSAEKVTDQKKTESGDYIEFEEIK